MTASARKQASDPDVNVRLKGTLVQALTDDVSVRGRTEPPRIWKQTWSGRVFPLIDFAEGDVDLFGDVAESLARTCRFGGHVAGPPYSVAQHCVIGADAALEETGDANLAAYVLLHDAHEFVFGDVTTPVAIWMADMEREIFGSTDIVRTLIATAKSRLDAVIWRAAGMLPPGKTYRAQITEYDLRLLATEQRQLLARSPISWGAEIDAARPIRLRGSLKAWPVARAADEYRDRLASLCPAARRA